VENEEEKCPLPYYFHNLIFSTQQAVFKTFKRKKTEKHKTPSPQETGKKAQLRTATTAPPRRDNHSGEEVNKTSCPTLHVFRVGISRRPMSSSPPPPPPVGC